MRQLLPSGNCPFVRSSAYLPRAELARSSDLIATSVSGARTQRPFIAKSVEAQSFGRPQPNKERCNVVIVGSGSLSNGALQQRLRKSILRRLHWLLEGIGYESIVPRGRAKPFSTSASWVSACLSHLPVVESTCSGKHFC